MTTTFAMKMKDIRIAEAELAGGMDCDCCCPLAQVMNRTTGKNQWSIGVCDAVNIYTGERYPLPENALKFKERWDRDGKPKPITFNLDILS
ncbi:hypothetical protein CCAX7_54200 [Capsulimonas corticalis]|uniref:Uncharacterized protein n=1 Tax=Capsulimonas corticalis TaxID=2219043 RepID=A0A402CNK1_9BACT|nr:hypothetical protein [Capsulimonas corticalis]BDI33369.1 hypothetical protein CCAX7_54200 [Capsulimonas corticalis]